MSYRLTSLIAIMYYKRLIYLSKRKKSNDEIIFEQILITDGYSLLLDSEYDSCEEIAFGAYRGYFIIRNGAYSKVIIENETLQIIITGFKIDSKELMKMAESIKK